MRLVIDMQGAQSAENRHRGIGRYSLALSKEMVRLRGQHDVVLALNGLFPETIEPLREAFVELLPEDHIHVWEAPGPVNAGDPTHDSRRGGAELVRETFLASLQPDMVLLTSLFECGDDAVASIGRFTSVWPTAVILYDLIPLIYRQIYLNTPIAERCYMNKIGHLRRADLLLSISESSGQEAIDYLNISPAKVVNISTACNDHFRPISVDNARRLHVCHTYGLIRPFVMYTGGIDPRKNIEGLIRAYARLPKPLRIDHQLAVVCAIQAQDRERLLRLAAHEGLEADELVITGFVSEDDLLALYNLCTMFVFPSWHEGFGLPALEAMACGRAVIGADASSVREVIGRTEALFDPHDERAIMRKIEEVLANDTFRAELERDGLARARNFSWEQTARRAWEALVTCIAARRTVVSVPDLMAKKLRPRLAYLSPLPPERSGISDYSAELLPELANYYQIEVIVSQPDVSDSWIRANCPIRDVAWFRQHGHQFDRVLYHFGNSEFHGHLVQLLEEIPGVVVLHDFFLSGIISHMDVYGVRPHAWARALVQAHGWRVLQALDIANDPQEVVWAYPCNLEVLQSALGIIVHSDFSRRLARQWYGPKAAEDWRVIPHLRVPALASDRAAARRSLNISDEEFLVCSFGLLGATKCNERLLEAWLASRLSKDSRCRLVFVGENERGEYGKKILDRLCVSNPMRRILISGWVDVDTFRQWLSAADLGVQLRRRSRGETSGTILDCMNYGLATIVNAHGSNQDLPHDAVYMMDDNFSDGQLKGALEHLWQDEAQRKALAERARTVVRNQHQPRVCAEQYAVAIEGFYRHAAVGVPGLVQSIASMEPTLDHRDVLMMATAIARNHAPRPRPKQLLVDISELVQRDAKSGIQRVVRALLSELLRHPPEKYAVEPVYARLDAEGYRYARRFTGGFLNIKEDWAADDLVDAWPGDIFLGLDLQPEIIPVQQHFLQQWRRRGIKTYAVVYDLLPVLLPDKFPPKGMELFQRWLHTITGFDGAFCISKVVAEQLQGWLQANGHERRGRFQIGWFHLGADFTASPSPMGLSGVECMMLERLRTRPTVLMVGTLEPRKGHAQVLRAFEQLWRNDVQVNLVIAGKQGWMVEDLVEMLRCHVERDKRLYWVKGLSDEYLENIYAASTCLLAASEGEGFGLPVIEAAKVKLPIIARDIPVFREIAGDYAFYFKGEDPADLAQVLQIWLEKFRGDRHPKSEGIAWLTWEQSAEQLKGMLP